MARGDQVYSIREFLNIQGVYEHHGIDCGDGTVIHYSKVGEATVTRSSLAEFTFGKPLYMKHYTVCYIPDVVVRRAESRLGEQQYNLMLNNCEHFAMWCKVGRSESAQVENVVPSLGGVGVQDLYGLVNQAVKSTQDGQAPALLNQAVADVQTAQLNLHAEYDRILREMLSWQQVATVALKQGREDLARAALQRKNTFKPRAVDLKTQLHQLTAIGETLNRNSRNLIH